MNKSKKNGEQTANEQTATPKPYQNVTFKRMNDNGEIEVIEGYWYKDSVTTKGRKKYILTNGTTSVAVSVVLVTLLDTFHTTNDKQTYYKH